MMWKNQLQQAKGVLLDFDGVVVDTEEIQQEVWMSTLNDCGILPPEGFSVVGRMDEEIASTLATADLPSGHLLKQKKEKFVQIAPEYPPLVPGVREFIGRRSQQSCKIAVVSNSRESRIRLITDHYNLTPFISVIVGARDCGRPKPDPDIFLIALKKLNLQPTETVAIEDSLPGVLAARSAGIVVIGLVTAHTTAELATIADGTFTSFSELF